MLGLIYRALGRAFPTRPAPEHPRRLVVIRPCCIGDVVMATATLSALRRAYPQAHLTFAVGGWSRRVLEHHPDLDAILDTGESANPAKHPHRFARLLRSGDFDLAVSLVRSPWMSLAVAWSGIPNRAGLDSGGRGFGYTVRARIDPQSARLEGDIFLDVARVLGVDVAGCWSNWPVSPEDSASMRAKLAARGIAGDVVVIHPGGGSNPGMVLDAKRWPAANFAALADALIDSLGVIVLLIGAESDSPILDAVRDAMRHPAECFAGDFSFGEIAALAGSARGYIGNDTGMTHLAAAAGGRTVMIFGPSDPMRYAPFVESALVLWKPAALHAGGVAQANAGAWDWSRDGIGVEEVVAQVSAFLR